MGRELGQAAQRALFDYMNLQAGEGMLVVADRERMSIGEALLEEALQVTGAELVEIPVGQINGQEPPAEAAQAMVKAQVVVAATTKSISHTRARRDASEAGARIVSMPGITEEIFIRSMKVDIGEVTERTAAVRKLLDAASTVRVTTAKGTDVTMGIEGRKTVGPLGGCRNPGDFSNLPFGEACLAPLEGTTQGVYVVDASFAGIGKVDEPIKVTVEDGEAVAFEGQVAEEIVKILDGVGGNSRNIAELGIGTNHGCIVSGTVLEDEKVYGTAHIAVGDSLSFGGAVKAGCHLDGVFNEPNIWVDGEQVMEDGKLK